MVHAANFSVGIPALQMVLQLLARTLPAGFDAEQVETHHVTKLDRPSGTARVLADVPGSRPRRRRPAAHALAAGGRRDRRAHLDLQRRGGDPGGDPPGPLAAGLPAGRAAGGALRRRGASRAATAWRTCCRTAAASSETRPNPGRGGHKRGRVPGGTPSIAGQAPGAGLLRGQRRPGGSSGGRRGGLGMRPLRAWARR